jgi:hypothetical protein
VRKNFLYIDLYTFIKEITWESAPRGEIEKQDEEKKPKKTKIKNKLAVDKYTIYEKNNSALLYILTI